MKTNYEDEYGNIVITSRTSFIPGIGDTIIIEDEEYFVKSRIFNPIEEVVTVMITQNMIKPKGKEDNFTGRLAEMNSAILRINSRQDVSEKKNRVINEKLGAVKQKISQRSQPEKKET